MGTTVGGKVIGELFAKEEPWTTGIGLFGVLLIRVGGTTRGRDLAERYGEDHVGHSRASERLFTRVVFKIIQRILSGVIPSIIQGERVKDHIGLLHRNASVHASVFQYDASIGISVDENIVSLCLPGGAGSDPDETPEQVGIVERVFDQRHRKSTVGD